MSQTTTFHLEIERTEGALPRLIGLIERRGFEVTNLHLGPHHNQGRKISLSVHALDDGRRVETLRFQILKLYGVKDLSAASASVAA